MQRVSKQPLAILLVLAILVTCLTSLFPVQAEGETEAEKAAAAAQAIVNAMTVSNETTADGILTAVNKAIGEATAAWSNEFFMLRAVNGAIVQVDGVEKGRTEVRDGFITGMITVTSGEDKADVVIDRTILAAYETFSYVATDVADPDSYCADGTTFVPANFSAKVVIVPDDVTTIANSTFKNLSSLEVLIVPDSVTKFEWTQCEGCSNLKVAILGDGITKLEGNNFSDCASLKYVKLPKGLTKVGEKTFYRCTALEDLILPSTVAGFGGSAFRATGLHELVLPTEVTSSVSSSVWTFAEMPNLNKIIVLGIDKFAFTWFSQASNAQIATWGGTQMAEDAGDRFVDLASVTFSSDITTLQSNASENAVTLTSIPAIDSEFTVPYISGLADKLSVDTVNKSFTLPTAGFIGRISIAGVDDELETVADAVRAALDTLTVTNDTTAEAIETAAKSAIGDSIFSLSWKRDFFKLRAVNGAIVEIDGEEKGRTDVRDGYIVGTLTISGIAKAVDIAFELPIKAGYETFSYTADDVADPLDYTFNGNTYQPDGFTAKVVIVPDDVTTVANVTFKGLNTLEVLIVPDSVTKFDWTQCEDCPNLKVVIFGDGITTMGGQNFQRCTSLQYVRLPKNLAQIGENSFRDCTSLEDIIIPASVTAIKGSAFRGSSLHDIILPTNVETLSSVWVFGELKNLENMVILGVDKFEFSKLEMVTTAKIVTWGDTVLAENAEDRFIDLASVSFKGDGTAASSVSDGKVVLSIDTEKDSILQLTYNVENVTENRMIIQDKTFEVPVANYMWIVSITADEAIQSLESLAKEAVENLEITASTTAADIEKAVADAMSYEDAIITWDTAYTVVAPTETTDGAATGVLRVTAYGKSFTVEISRILKSSSSEENSGSSEPPNVPDTGESLPVISVIVALLSVIVAFGLRRRHMIG